MTISTGGPLLGRRWPWWYEVSFCDKMRNDAVSHCIRPWPLPASLDKIWIWNHFSQDFKRRILPLAGSASERLGFWQLLLSSILTGKGAEHGKWLLPSVGPYDLVGGGVTATAKVCARPRIQLLTQGATGGCFHFRAVMESLMWSCWSLPKVFVQPFRIQAERHREWFNFLQIGSWTRGFWKLPLSYKIQYHREEALSSTKQIRPVEAQSGTQEAGPSWAQGVLAGRGEGRNAVMGWNPKHARHWDVTFRSSPHGEQHLAHVTEHGPGAGHCSLIYSWQAS